MTEPLRLSVVIPVYNVARTLAETIQSVREQTRRPDEIVVVDDASTDESLAIARSLGSDIQIIRQAVNLGPAAARNRGIKAATGNIIAFLDADDLWPPNAMTSQMRRLEQAPYPAIVLGRIRVIGDSLPARPLRDAGKSLEGFALNFGSAVIRRQVFDQIGFLDENLRFGEDTDWFMRAREQSVHIQVVNEITLVYRRHDRNMTHDFDHAMKVGLQMLKRSIDRRRAGGRLGSLPSWPAPSDC